ncbi:hydroxysqualene dehydroxylase HpnE [Thermostilla marina]
MTENTSPTGTSPDDRRPRVAVVGGGAAGLTAAWRLAEAGFVVTVFERRRVLGGRANSFLDPFAGIMLDTCRHLVMGCCERFLRLCEEWDVRSHLQRQSRLYFVDNRGGVFSFRPWTWLPPPLHWMPGLGQLRFLSLRDRLCLARSLRSLVRDRRRNDRQRLDVPITAYLARRRVPEIVLRRFFAPVLISALNELPEYVPAQTAAFVFDEMFFRRRRGHEIYMFDTSSAEFFDRIVAKSLEAKGIHIRRRVRVRQIVRESESGTHGRFRLRVEHADRERETMRFDAVVTAVPPRQVTELFAPHEELSTLRAACSRLTACGIATVHVWYDRPLTQLPNAALLDGLGQWAFFPTSEPEKSQPHWYAQVVISAADRLLSKAKGDPCDAIRDQMQAHFPRSQAKAVHARLVWERHAVLPPDPEMERARPVEGTPVSGWVVAGDWTATSWPGTLESAVRSGEAAASRLMDELRPPMHK